MTNYEKYFGSPEKAAKTIHSISDKLCYYWFRCDIDYELHTITNPCPLAEIGLCGTLNYKDFNLANAKWLLEEAE